MPGYFSIVIQIKKDNKYFCTQRGHGVRKGLWEFPGGHIEENETGEDACTREMIEELNAIVQVDKYLGTVEHDYEDFHLSMDAYLCVCHGKESGCGSK